MSRYFLLIILLFSTPSLSFFNLPGEMIQEIFKYLQFSDLFKLALVDKKAIIQLKDKNIKKDFCICPSVFRTWSYKIQNYLELINTFSFKYPINGYTNKNDLLAFIERTNLKFSLELHINTHCVDISDIFIYNHPKILKFITHISIITGDTNSVSKLIKFIANNAESLTTLKNLKIKGSYSYVSYLTKEHIEDLVKAGPCLKNLKKLYLGSMNKDDDFANVRELFRHASKLEKLTLQNNFIYGCKGLDMRSP